MCNVEQRIPLLGLDRHTGVATDSRDPAVAPSSAHVSLLGYGASGGLCDSR